MAVLCSLLILSFLGTVGQGLSRNYSLLAGEVFTSAIEYTQTGQNAIESISTESAALRKNTRGNNSLERGSSELFLGVPKSGQSAEVRLVHNNTIKETDNVFIGTETSRTSEALLGQQEFERSHWHYTAVISSHTQNRLDPNISLVLSENSQRRKHKRNIIFEKPGDSSHHTKNNLILHHVLGHKRRSQSAGIYQCHFQSVEKEYDAQSDHTEGTLAQVFKLNQKESSLRNVTQVKSITQTSSIPVPVVKPLLWKSTQNSHRVRRSGLSDLPVHKVSNTVSYVTSPGFRDFGAYPNNYDGHFFINISESECVVVSINQFHTDNDIGCNRDYLTITEIPQKTTTKLCGFPRTEVTVYRSSLQLHFHTNEATVYRGFKLFFAVLPRHEEPERLRENVFNCSVPHFHRFKPLLNCNAVTECDGGEDERDCWFRSKECGEDFLDTQGTKCYRLVRPDKKLTWTDAETDCLRHGQTMLSYETIEEFRQFSAFLFSAKNVRYVFLGAQLVKWQQPVSIAMLYRFVWQWVNGQTAFLLRADYSRHATYCSAFDNVRPYNYICNYRTLKDYVCEFPKQGNSLYVEAGPGRADEIFMDAQSVTWNVTVVKCPSGHMTRDFLSCDSQADCNAMDSFQMCRAEFGKVSMFMCQESQTFMHYSLLCDHIQHCSDNSDESFCQHPVCSLGFDRDGKCINEHQLCDGKLDTYDGSDETCIESGGNTATQYPPGAVYFDGKGGFRVEQLNSSECPPTHFLCPYHFCLPVYLRCNGILDCPDRNDEAGCDIYTCPGFYRCRGSKVCLHADNVCDGVPQCPEQDDELLCDFSCPDQCHCQGLAFFCSTSFSASSYPALRYLDASGSGMTPADLTDNLYIIFLRLSGCGISSLPLNTTLPNLQQLDLSWNELTQLDMQLLWYLINLRVLVLTGNPLTQIVSFASSVQDVLKLQSLDISVTSLTFLNTSLFAISPGIRMLNISGSKITTITNEGFQLVPKLETFDSRNSPLKYFPDGLLRQLTALKNVYSNNYKLCCETTLPLNFNSRDCHTVEDLLASCEDLLRSSPHRVFLWVLLVSSICGNIGSFVLRLCLNTERGTLGGISMFITSLSVADFLTGIYLTFISVADLIYHGQYLRHDNEWKNSTACNIAGFISLLSTEVSVLTLCLIALDRFLVLLLPCNKLHFSHRSALVTCGVVWLVSVVLAAVPLLPMTQHWEFYSQTSICTPLPFTDSFQGYDYHFSIIILLNLIVSVLTALGQAAISWSIRASSMSAVSENSSNDSTVARCLTTVVMSNFLCWFSVGLMGVLAATGTPIPGEIGVITAIFVLPFNSALNPFLYIFNIFTEKRKKRQEALLMERLTRLRRLDTSKNKARISSRSHED